MSTPLVATNSRVKEARKLSRRSVRTERRLFLADGPKAVEGALSVAGCVVEVFATPAATERYDGPVVDVAWHLVDDAALASLAATDALGERVDELVLRRATMLKSLRDLGHDAQLPAHHHQVAPGERVGLGPAHPGVGGDRRRRSRRTRRWRGGYAASRSPSVVRRRHR